MYQPVVSDTRWNQTEACSQPYTAPPLTSTASSRTPRNLAAPLLLARPRRGPGWPSASRLMPDSTVAQDAVAQATRNIRYSSTGISVPPR